jgi:hypothetical protein
VFGRFNSLIIDFISLFVGFISLFGRVRIYTRISHNINDLRAQIRSISGPYSRFSQYIPVDQGTRSAAPYSGARWTLGREELVFLAHRN